MSLDGLRAWIGLLERKLTMRTRVFLVLVAIAVGGAGAGIYLAIEAGDDNSGGGDVEAVQDELNVRIDTLESQIQALEAEDTDSLLPGATPEAQPVPSPEGDGGSGGATDDETAPRTGGAAGPQPRTNAAPKPGSN